VKYKDSPPLLEGSSGRRKQERLSRERQEEGKGDREVDWYLAKLWLVIQKLQ
jgi:hypothetical protein